MRNGWAHLALAGLMLTVMPGAAPAGLALWEAASVSPSACRSHDGGPDGTRYSTRLQGFKWPIEPGSGIAFVDAVVRHLNDAALGRGDAEALRATLLTAAREGALARLDFEGRGGSSPSFVSAVVVKAAAYATGYLRSARAISLDELLEIDAWAQRLIANAGRRAGSPDHHAAEATARLFWAAATGNSAAFDRAAERVTDFLARMDGAGRFSTLIRVNNEVMHHIVPAARVLELNGVAAFAPAHGARPLDTAIARHARDVLEVRDHELRTTAAADAQARSIFRAQGWATHLAWIPAYLSAPGTSRDTRGEVRALDRALRTVDGTPYWGIALGVHSGCLYGG